MSIEDFIKEAKKLGGSRKSSSVDKELHELALTIYNNIKGGNTKECVRKAAGMIVKSIAPNLSPADKLNVVISIESIALTVLLEFFNSGTIIKREKYKDETRE